MNLLAHRWGRLTAFFLLYITEGLPLGFAAGAVAVYMKREGVGVDEMGAFLGALYAPWAFKWAAGPFVDLIGSRRFGRRRVWILGTQAVMILGLILSSFIDYTAQIQAFTLAMVVVNGFCAVQDVAIDALAVGSLREEERGLGNGLMFAGAYIGQALGGSGMLYLASRTGSLNVGFYAVAGLVGVIWLITLFLMREPDTGEDTDPVGLSAVFVEVWKYAKAMWQAVMVRPPRPDGQPHSFRDKLTNPPFMGFLFAILPASAMAMGLALQAALAVEVGLADEQIANLGLIGAVGAAGGSVLGGLISDRTGHRRTLAVYVVLTLLPTAFLAWSMHTHGWILPVPEGVDRVPPAALADAFWYSTLAYGFFSGLTYGTRMAIFMSLCSREVAATQFTLYMAMQNLAISYSSTWQGFSVESWGYPTTLGLDCLLGVASLSLLPFLVPTPATEQDEVPEQLQPV